MSENSFEIKVIPTSDSSKHKEDEMKTNPLDRVQDEFDGWVMYKEMYEKDKTEQRYKIASQQEFGHLLMALEDFTDEIKKHKPDAIEIEEFNRFIEHLRLRS